jgi:hypothetical protein
MTFIVRVICRVNFKTVQMYENFVVKSLILVAGRDGLTGSFAALGLALEMCELQMCLAMKGWVL